MRYAVTLFIFLALQNMARPLPAVAIEVATIDMGRALFASTHMGKSGRSCVSCHPDGQGLDKIGDFNDAELKDIINACIRDALHGTPFASDTQELNALLLYVRSFGPAAQTTK